MRKEGGIVPHLDFIDLVVCYCQIQLMASCCGASDNGMSTAGRERERESGAEQ